MGSHLRWCHPSDVHAVCVDGRPAGAIGARGVTAANELLAGPVPFLFTAVTVNVDHVLLASPSPGSSSPPTCAHFYHPGDALTHIPGHRDPPSDDDGVQLTTRP